MRHKYPGEDHLKYSYGSKPQGVLALLVLVLAGSLLFWACQKTVVIIGDGDYKVEAPSSIRVNINREYKTDEE